MNHSAEAYARFLPDRLVRWHQLDPGAPAQARAETCRAAVMLADVIGYTALTERYSQRGAEGVEQLKFLLDGFFDRLNSVIFDHGGDILSFAGDSVLALWCVDGADERAAARLAAECGLAAQTALDRTDCGEALTLRMRIAVAAGEVFVATVGGRDGKWEYVAAGEPLAQAGGGLQSAEAGSVVVAPDAWRMVGRSGSATSLGNGYVRLIAMHTASDARRAREPVRGDDSAAALRCYIPKPVLEQLDAGHSDWLAEFRRITTVFVTVQGISYGQPDALARLQQTTAVVQDAVGHYEGTLSRLFMHDKGTNALCVWGIPGRLHENDAARAVAAGLAIYEGLRAAGHDCGIGITTGRALCGLFGGVGRYEYTVAGDAVNLAARLMVAAHSGVLCDGATSDAARGVISFECLAPIRVKGKDAPIAVERPRPVAARAAPAAVPAAGPDSGPKSAPRFLGREAEIGRLRAALEKLHTGAGSVITIEGEPGVGKSRMVAELKRAAQQSGVDYLLGQADAIERNTTYFAWREILRQFLAQKSAPDAAAQREFLEAHFNAEPILRTWLPLLNDVLALGFAEGAVTAQMNEQARAESTSELLVHLLREVSVTRPLVIVLEDSHWMDSMSWSLAARLAQRVAPVLLVLVMRTGHLPDSAAGRELIELAEDARIKLAPLSRADTEALVCDRLGVQTVAPEVVSLIHGKTDGHPLFSEELCYALRDSGGFSIDGGRCVIAADAEGRGAPDLPATIEGIIAGRIDRLTASEQLTLKVAGVIGRGFALPMIVSIHPVGLRQDEIAGQFQRFIALDLVRFEESPDEVHYHFKHAITQEVTYGLLAFAQRRQLHRAAAGWYQFAHRADLSAAYPLLAHHWSRAGDPPKAFDYLHKAGAQAISRYANQEAAEFLREARAMLDRLDQVEMRGARVDCERLLGNARFGLGQLAASRAHFEQSFALAGSAVPSSPRALAFGIFGQLAVQARNRILGPRRAAGGEPAQAEREAAVSWLRLGNIAYFGSDTARMLYAGLRSLNAAERAGPCSELARIYASWVGVAGRVPLLDLARRYSDLALRVTDEIDEPYATAQVLLFLSMRCADIGDWRTGVERAEQAIELCRKVGDNRQAEECMVVAAYLYLHSGAPPPALRYFETAAAEGRRRGDKQTTGWGLLGVARVHLAQGRAQQAQDALRESVPFVADRLSGIELHGLSALAHLRRDEFDDSLRAARSGLELVLQVLPISFATLTGTAAVAETLLAHWSIARRDGRAGDVRTLAMQSRQAVRALRAFARNFPMGAPQALLQRGNYWFAVGRRRRAAALWSKAQDAAAALAMPFDEARAAASIARHATGFESVAARACAAAIFDRLDVDDAGRAFEGEWSRF